MRKSFLPSPLAEAMACVSDSSAEPDSVTIEKPWVVASGPESRWTLQSKQGLRLEVFSWACVGPRVGTAVLFHGIDGSTRFDFLRLCSMDFDVESSEDGVKYERSMIAALNAAGFDCVGADMQGYGLSEAAEDIRGYFERFEDLVDDAELVCRDAADRLDDPRPFLVGASYGGLLAASLAARLEVWRKSSTPPIECAGLVLLAPALSLEKAKAEPVNAILLPAAALLSQYAPTLAIGDKPASPLYPQLAQAMRRDTSLPLDSPHRLGCYDGNLRARVAAETLLAVDRLRENIFAGDLSDLPAFLLHSKADTLCDPDGSVLYADANPAATLLWTQDIPGCDQMWHVLMQEPGADVLFDRVTTWLKHRAAAPDLLNTRIP